MNATSDWVDTSGDRKNAIATLLDHRFKNESFLVERVNHDVGCACIARTETQYGVFLGHVVAHMLSKPIKYTINRYAIINR